MRIVFKALEIIDRNRSVKILSIFSKLAGVQSMEVDAERGLLMVVAEVDADVVESALRKAKFRVHVLAVEGHKAERSVKREPDRTDGEMDREVDLLPPISASLGAMDREVELLPPISASLGAMVSLSRKLDTHLHIQHKNEIDELRTRLLKLSKARDPPVTARIWMKDVRELSYDMDNCVDAQTDWNDKLPGFLARVKEANGRYDRYMLKSVPICTNNITIDGRGIRTVDGCKRQDTTLVVGIHVHDGPFARLCHLLTDGDEQLKVLSVFGVAGIGKTTLVKQIWREHKLRDYFHCGAFVQTAKKPDMRRILRSILAQVRPHQPPDASEVHELIHDIREHLQDKRYFLIIDDIWATSVWDVVTRGFPEGTHGSRIITTTEIEDISLACCSYQSRYIFKMEPLSDSHSKELFTSAVFGSGKEKYRQIDEVSDEIIKRCEGLPQAIVSISSVLAILGEANTLENWEEIQNSLPTNTTSKENVKQVLNFCYRCLPSCLQTCLLYLSIYPENYIFLKEDIMKQWVAEGFIYGPKLKDKMEVAGSYFDNLVKMGLIQHIDLHYSNEVQYYAVHHMVHDIITSKSIEENFITVLDYSKRTTRFSNKVSRLSLQFGSATYATTPASTGLSQVRSLAFIGLMSCFPSILEFKLLRSLIVHIWGDQPSTGFSLGVICDLLLLRYLQVTCNDTVYLPYQMRGLKHLETIEINARIAAIPSDIFHLQSLLHLRLGGGTELPDVTGIVKNASVNPPPSASGRAISLDDSSSPPDSVHTIELLPPIRRMPKWIGQLRNLCVLKIVVIELQSNDISNLQGLPALTVLSLYVQRRTSTTEPISFVTGAFPALEYFEFRCGVLCLAFEEGAMPSLQRIQLGFNAHSGEQYGCSLYGIEDMLSVQKISVLIGSAVGAEERDMKAAEYAIKKALGKHHSNVSIKRADMVEEEFDPPEEHHSFLVAHDICHLVPEEHHSIGGKHPSTSSEQPGSGKQEAQDNIKQKDDTNSQLIKRKSNKKEHASVERRKTKIGLKIADITDERCKYGVLKTISKVADPVTTPEAYRTNERSKEKALMICKALRSPLTKKTYHGAPPPLLLFNLGSEGVPRQTGSRENSARKSLHLASSSSPSIWTPSPSPSMSSTRIRRTTSSGRGKRYSTALLSRGHLGGSRSVAALRGAPPPERISASTKRRSGRAILSPTPPVAKPHNPRLCTGEI